MAGYVRFGGMAAIIKLVLASLWRQKRFQSHDRVHKKGLNFPTLLYGTTAAENIQRGR